MYVNMSEESAKRERMISFRVTSGEFSRVKQVIGEVLKRNPYAKEADVLRELIGVVDTGLVNDVDRLALKGIDFLSQPESQENELVMSFGKPIAPSLTERLAAERDIEKAREDAHEHQRTKRRKN